MNKTTPHLVRLANGRWKVPQVDSRQVSPAVMWRRARNVYGVSEQVPLRCLNPDGSVSRIWILWSGWTEQEPPQAGVAS